MERQASPGGLERRFSKDGRGPGHSATNPFIDRAIAEEQVLETIIKDENRHPPDKTAPLQLFLWMLSGERELSVAPLELLFWILFGASGWWSAN
eukprot:2799250-Amphidinium_carterae.1